MATSAVPQNPTAHNVASLLPKLSDADPDIRYMTLNDLHQMLAIGHPTFISHDYKTCARVVEGLLSTLNDTNGDVQNMAIKTLGPFVNKAPESILCPTIEKVSSIKTDHSIDTSVPALATRAIVVALPRPVQGVPRGQKVQEAYVAISKALIPRLVGRVVIPAPGGQNPPPPKGMLQSDLETGNDSNSLDLLTEVARCFGPMLQEPEIEALEQTTMQLLESERCGTVMKKKAVTALCTLATHFSDVLMAGYVSYTIEQLRQPHLTAQQRKLYMTIYGSLARSIPQKFGPYLKTIAPFVLAPMSQEELDQQREAQAESEGDHDLAVEEVREAALVAMESFFQACASDMRFYTREAVESAIRFLKYDPNMAEDDDDDMDNGTSEDEELEDEDFEEETGFEDEDDMSWKIRRTSAKLLYMLISSLESSDVALYGLIAPALIARFKEREESVRTEIIATLAHLIVKTGSVSGQKGIGVDHPQPQSRKRRRGGSDALGDLHAQQTSMNGYTSPSTPPPTDASGHGLAKINPDIVRGAATLLKTSTVPTKQAVISLLKDMVVAQHGGLSKSADTIIKPVVETMKLSAQHGVSNVASNALRIETLMLLRGIAETHSSRILQPHLSIIVPALVSAAKDRYAKVSGEAFSAIEMFIKALTPSRSAASKSQNSAYVAQLYRVVTERISASDTDTEVREKAVQALGLLVGRTSGPAGASLLSQNDRYGGQKLLAERMRNELTRLACVRAVDTIAVLAQSKKDFKPDFVSAVALELGAQLRKSSRSLRGASLSALKMLAVNQASRECMEGGTIDAVISFLLPLISIEDLHMLGPALIILGAFAKDTPQLVVNDSVIAAICGIVPASLSGAALDALLACVETIGRAGAGKTLMSALLKVGVQGNTDVTGQVIGTLLVSASGNVGVKLDDFVVELQNSSRDESRQCLALSILGEAGLRLGAQCLLKPESFTPYFSVQSEKVKLAAAVALGRAGAGNVKAYLPRILDNMEQGKQYLLLHSVKELLQHSNAEDDIRPYTKGLWDNIINSGQAEDNKVVGAECIGRLAIVDPTAYLPQLQTFLRNPNPTIRGMVIAALRYTFSDTDTTYNQYLSNSIIPMLTTMLTDSDLENQRLALTTFNSAFHNKPALVLPHLPDLLPYAMQASVPRPELIKEVTMGPFKHKVDEGIEIRKSAYETLYALLESPASRQRLDIPAFYARIAAGLADEHEIRMLCALVLAKLLVLAPAESARRLAQCADAFRAVLAFRPKDTAVKQELEKIAEEQKAVVKVSVRFQKVLGGEECRAWREYWEWVRKEFAGMVKGAEGELKETRER